LGQIGSPNEAPFKPDPFQTLATELVANYDTIVSAPTGSGKTWIAKQAIERELSLGKRAWYASPLKALSNSKFLEFGRQFGQENVGLLTGDHKINAQAPLIVGTTEILRNQLYDSMVGLADIECNLVVLDEAHYLGDPERGVVWEEVLIYTPPRVRFLLLSATVANSAQLAKWLGYIRESEVKVVNGDERPVPLEPLALNYDNLSTLDQYARGNKAKTKPKGLRHRGSEPEVSHFPKRALGHVGHSVRFFQRHNLLPAIFFLKSRADCDKAATTAYSLNHGEPEATTLARKELIDSYVDQYPILRQYGPIGPVRKKGLAAHHAGHLPQYKMLVEELMSRNLLLAIFATSTVAAGVNFPARSVIISNSDRFNGTDFVDLTATELLQMTGRAGRRGMDNIGFAIVVPGPYMNVKLMSHLFASPPDPVASSLKINFTMVLNLLNAFEPKDAKDLLCKSLATWQLAKTPSKANLTQASKSLWDDFKRHKQFLASLGLVDKNNHLTYDGLLTASLRLEHPIVIYSAIKARVLPQDPRLLAAVLAALTAEKPPAFFHGQRQYDTAQDKTLKNELLALRAAVAPITMQLMRNNFPYPEAIGLLDPAKTIHWWANPAKAIHWWANGGSWEKATDIYRRDHGDLIRLVSLVCEQLNQLSNIKMEGNLAEVAKEAKKLIYREPVA
jgi:superfamily II RNA helicase